MDQPAVKVRPPVELEERDVVLHGAIAFSLKDLSSRLKATWHTNMNVALGDLVRGLIKGGQIAANTPVKAVRISMTNESPIPLACNVHIIRIGVDVNGDMSFGPVDVVEHTHYARNLSSAASVICHPHKTVTAEVLRMERVEDSFPVRGGVYEMRSIRKAKALAGGFCRMDSAGPLYGFILEGLLIFCMEATHRTAIPDSKDIEFWGAFSNQVRAELTGVMNGVRCQLKTSAWETYSRRLVELRTNVLMAADLLTSNPLDNKVPVQSCIPNVPFGLSVRFRPVNLMPVPAPVSKSTATSDAFMETNPWVVSASSGGGTVGVNMVREAQYTVPFAVTITFAVHPPDVMAQDNEKFPFDDKYAPPPEDKEQNED